MSEILGPNVKKLIGLKVAAEAIPKGGNVNDALNFLMDKERISKTLKESAEWVKQTIYTIRQAAQPNPWINCTDEEIAFEILRQIETKKAKRNEK